MSDINISNLTLNYKNYRAVDNISLTLKSGIIFGLLGPNGAGKTSLVKMMTGLLRPSSGKITIAGKEPCKHSSEIKALIGLVPQETALYEELSAYGNCEFQASLYRLSAKNIKKRIEYVLTLVDLKERMKEPVRNFSGGMKRRLAIGKALLHDPQILILDEPTLGVDVQGTHKIWDYILTLKEMGKTIIITTNVMNEADKLSDEVCIIDHGKMIVKGAPSELKNKLATLEILLSFQNQDILNKARKRLGINCRIRNDKLVISVQNGSSDLVNVINKLDETTGPSEIELKRPSLDDVFLSYTGKSLRD